MPDRLTEIKSRLAAATPGPWHYNPEDGCTYSKRNHRLGKKEVDRILSAHAPSDLAYLLRLVEAGNQLAMSASEVRCGHRDQCDCSLCEDLNTYAAMRNEESK